MNNKMTKLAQAICGVAGITLGVSAYQALAQENDGDSRRNAMEEVIVTAQRSEEGIQDVPIAVTALSGEMLEDRQVINPSDLQLNAPNVSFTATNFGGSSFSIRGIGQLVISSSGSAGVSTHINQIPIAGNLNAIEYFDVERVEILRGPQGTLFGRNATGGAVNVVTKQPSSDAFDGFVDFEYGNYDHIRAKAAVNIPLGCNLALRVAGMTLDRAGYIKNRAFGQVNANAPGETLPGIDEDVDGRDLWVGRATLLWQPSDHFKAWVQYNQFKEDDDRVRVTNQVCKRTAQPVPGCEPNEFGMETQHIASTTAGIIAANIGLIPAGGGTGVGTFDYARPLDLGLRETHTDFEPIYQYDETNVLFGADIEVGAYSISLLAAYQDLTSYTRQDYNLNVGANLILPGNVPGHPAAGLGVSFPTSNPPVGPNANRNANNPCAVEGPSGVASAGRAPNRRPAAVDPSCLHPYGGTTRLFTFDQTDNETTYWTAEAKIASHYDGAINFTVGVNAYDTESSTDYYVIANTLDTLVLANGFYPGYFVTASNELNQTGIAGYGELYVDVTPAFKLTFGLRYNIDKKDIQDSNLLYNSVVAVGGLTTRRGLLFSANAALQDANGVPIDIATIVDAVGAPAEAAVPDEDTDAAEAAVRLINLYDTNDGAEGLLQDLRDANDAVQTLLGTTALAPLVIDAAAAGSALATAKKGFAAASTALAAADTALAAADTALAADAMDSMLIAAQATAMTAQATAMTAQATAMTTQVTASTTQEAAKDALDAQFDSGSNADALNAIEIARLAIRDIPVPIVPAPGENRILTGSPSEFEWKEFSGRVGFDWALSSDTLVYGFFSRGYKPGGFNPAINEEFQDNSSFDFKAEEVNALEVGTKNTLLEGSLVLNGAAFFYDYKGLQVTRIANNSSLNENIDAEVMGLELELIWQPPILSNLTIDASYSYLSSEVGSSSSVDPINRTGGDTDFLTFKNLGPGSATGLNYVIRRTIFSDQLITAALTGAAAGTAVNESSGFYPADRTLSGTANVQIPALVSRPGLEALLENSTPLRALAVALENAQRTAAGVAPIDATDTAAVDSFIESSISDGLPVNLEGNSLPNSPEHTVHFGASYAFPLGSAGSLSLRGDYYWQSESYAREFNSKGDEIDGWDQINASLAYVTADERLQVRLWIRNITNSENVTGKYLTSDTSGSFRNYFLTEPRIYGASVRFNFN